MGDQLQMGPDAVRLRQLIRFNEPAAPVAIPALLALYWAYPDGVLLCLAGAVVPTFILQRLAIHWTHQNRVTAGTTALSFAIWCPTLTLAIFAPDLWVLTCIFSILSVVLALPFVSTGHVLRLLIGASVILLIGAVSTAIDPPLPFERVPDALFTALAAIAAFAGAILCMFSIWQSSGRLRETLAETQAANGALRDSERTLERKVEERTAALAESHRLLAEARDAALDASRAKSDFLANMSHELRTPLNAIIGYSEMLHEEAREAGDHDYLPDLERVVSSGRYLLTLINSVLDLAKIEAGKMEAHIEPIDLDDFVRDVEGTVAPLVRKNSNRLEVRTVAPLGTMHTDATKVRQVLFNLLSNASKFTRDGVVSLEVTRESDASADEWIRFRVGDTGIGMTPEQLERVFEAFSQAESTTARDYGGTGLGLAITRQFCEMLGGSIRGDSELGAGSTFEVRLPAHSRLTEPEVADLPAAASGHARTSVLVVDDDPAARDLLSRFLRREGFTVTTAATGEQALRLARELLPDAITLDVIMPVMDGWEVLRTLKADPLLAGIPVVLLTITDDHSLGYALGAAEYLTKPVDWAQLATIFHRFQQGERSSAVVVDDDASARDMAGRALERAGWAVRRADNGREALALVAEATPSLILLDLMMPEMDGFEFVAELHQRPEWRTIPIIVITAMDVSAADRSRLGGGVARIFQKGSYRLPDLVEEIRRTVATHEERTP